MIKEINYDKDTRTTHKAPEVKKYGACSPFVEMMPFVFKGKLMRFEHVPAEKLGKLPFKHDKACEIVRDVESGKVISLTLDNVLFASGYVEGDKAYCLGVDADDRTKIMISESCDLVNWSTRTLLTNPDCCFFNTSLTKGPDGYVLALETNKPEEYVGVPFTALFATSKDMVNWTFMSYDKMFPTQRYLGGPYLKYVDGWYYLISVTELPCYRFTNYIYRTRDFETWYDGLYNPMFMFDNNDRKLSGHAVDFDEEDIKNIEYAGVVSSISDIDMCDYNGKVYINYLIGNQLGFCYMAEATYDGTVEEYLKSFFE